MKIPFAEQLLALPASENQGLASDPACVTGGEENRSASDVLRLRNSPKRSLGLDHLAEIALRKSHGVQAFSFHHAWIERVDADLLWAQFFRERNRNCVDGRFS